MNQHRCLACIVFAAEDVRGFLKFAVPTVEPGRALLLERHANIKQHGIPAGLVQAKLG